MRVLVTGGAGLIGIALRALLRDQGHQVVAIDRTRFGRDDPALQEMSLENARSLHALDELEHGAQLKDGVPIDRPAAGVLMLGAECDKAAHVLENRVLVIAKRIGRL